MVRVRRYPYMSALLCALTLACALLRDLCVSAGQQGWARVLLCVTLLLLPVCFALMSCRFFVDEQGVGVGFLLRVRRADWQELAALGLLQCNSRRRYLYGMYRGRADFLSLLHHAPRCGSWGFVVPVSRKLLAGIGRYCPLPIDLAPMPRYPRAGRMRALWHQAALYALAMLPAAALAFATGSMMLVYAATHSRPGLVLGLSLGALALCAAGLALLYRVVNTALTCPAYSKEGVCAGRGLYLPWNEVRFGYVHRVAQISGMFMLSLPVEETARLGAPPIGCLSVPDTSTMLLAYLTYCPHANQGIEPKAK